MDFFRSRRDLSKYMNKSKISMWSRIKFILAVLCLIAAVTITVLLNF